MLETSLKRLPIHFDPIRAHRSCAVPDRYEFVPNRLADYVNVFDLSTARFVKQIRVSGRPDVTATPLDGRYVYMAGEYLSIIDLETLTVMRTLTGEGIHAHYALNLFPDGRRMFLFNYDGSIAVLNHADEPLRACVEKAMIVNQPALPDASVGGKGHFTADGQHYINANWHTNSVFLINLSDDYSITTIVPSGFDKPDDLVMTADERKGYTASHGSTSQAQGAVHVFDPIAGCITKTILVGRKPAGLAMSPDSRILYATNVPDGSISAIGTLTDEVLFTASAADCYRQAGISGDHLDIEGVTVSADGKTLYAYSVNYGALVIFEDLGNTNQPRLIMGAE
jgi:DNA-binding beta-propeller fold protein YncE